MISCPSYHATPQEKLDRFGVSSLDNLELLSLLLGGGDSCVDLSRQTIDRFGSISAIAAAGCAELAEIPGIGPGKAARFAAAFELAARLAREQIQSAPLDTPERIHECFAPQIGHLPQERVMVATVDTRLRHTASSLISMGTVNECVAHPREVMRPVITRAAYGFILIHNHPSGDPSPSRADESITRRIAEVAETMQVRFVDHVIIGKSAQGRTPYYSFLEAGLIS